MPGRDNLSDRDSDSKFFRRLAELRVAWTAAKCGSDQERNPARGADDLVALVKERRSLPYAIEACEGLARVVKELWSAADPNECESPYERWVERLAFDVILSRHKIPREEVEEAKNAIDACVTEELI